MKVEHVQRVKSITFEEADLNALMNVFEAARKWVEFGTSRGNALAGVTQEELAAMNSLRSRVFMAFDE